MTTRPILADSVSPDEYVPLYSFSKNSSYRHGGLPATTAGVADKRNAPVAAKTDRRIASN